MKTILVVLLLVSFSALLFVSTSVFAQSVFSPGSGQVQQPQQSYSERHRQKMERQAYERGQQLRQQAQHEQHMRELQNQNGGGFGQQRYKGIPKY